MRYCPVCDARYDDETIKFCTKDGTPLVEENKPNFVILPSESSDEPILELGEDTVVRSKAEPAPPQNAPERFTIPTTPPSEQHVRPRQVYYQPPQPQPNTMKTVALTIIGTLVVLSFGAGLMWLFQKEPPANLNINTSPINLNSDMNTNGFNSNFNFNFNSNLNTNANAYASNFNFNLNAPFKTPTNTPTPRQTPTPSPSPLFPSPSPTPRTPGNVRPLISPTPRPPVMMSNRPPGNR